MTRQLAKHSGDRTSPAQQRINRANSLATLSRLLELNFSAGAQMITLGYESAGYSPVWEFANADIRAWERLARAQMGGTFQYVRAIGQVWDNKPATVHRIITAYPKETATALAENWIYGPVWVDEIEAGKLPALAKWLAANAAVPNRNTWASSRGLKRS